MVKPTDLPADCCKGDFPYPLSSPGMRGQSLHKGKTEHLMPGIMTSWQTFIEVTK